MAKVNWLLKGKIVEKFGTQSDFAEEIGFAFGTISRVVRGRQTLSPEAKQVWAARLGCKVKELFPE